MRPPSCQKRGPISIHALREEGDPGAVVQGGGVVGISIHALREEGDNEARQLEQITSNFYPRPPRGGRPRTPPRG